MIFRTFFLLFTASVRSRPPGPPAVPGVFLYTFLYFFMSIKKVWRLWRIVIVHISGSNDRNILLKYVIQNSVGACASFQCTLCGKTNGQKNNIMNHVESIHFPDSFTYPCHLCDKIVKTKSALNLHNARYHSKKHQH